MAYGQIAPSCDPLISDFCGQTSWLISDFCGQTSWFCCKRWTFIIGNLFPRFRHSSVIYVIRRLFSSWLSRWDARGFHEKWLFYWLPAVLPRASFFVDVEACFLAGDWVDAIVYYFRNRAIREATIHFLKMSMLILIEIGDGCSIASWLYLLVNMSEIKSCFNLLAWPTIEVTLNVIKF